MTLENKDTLVAKISDGKGDLTIESQMLAYLSSHTRLPVPNVLYTSSSLLLMQFLPGNSTLSNSAEIDAARHIAALHSIQADQFGFASNTLIGPLPQPNAYSPLWIPFFRDHRLLYMARLAEEAGRLPGPIRSRLCQFADHLEEYLIEPDRPSLIHGDLWAGNILSNDIKVTGFIDPAIYFAHAEIELAYSTLFSTFGKPFFDAYQEQRPLEPGFFEGRRDIYNLYPLLVHVRLFGGHYVGSVDTTLLKFGY